MVHVDLGGIIKTSGKNGYCFKIYQKDERVLQLIRKEVENMLLALSYDVDSSDDYYDVKEWEQK